MEVLNEPLPNQTTKSLAEIKADIDKAMLACWSIIRETQALYPTELEKILIEKRILNCMWLISNQQNVALILQQTNELKDIEKEIYG